MHRVCVLACAADGKPVPLGEDEKAELEHMALRRRREAVREAWRRWASCHISNSPRIDAGGAFGWQELQRFFRKVFFTQEDNMQPL